MKRVIDQRIGPEAVAKWAASPEGRRLLEEAYAEGVRIVKVLDAARKIDPELLNKPMDL